MKFTWTTYHTLDIADEEIKQMIREVKRLERVDEFEQDEAISAVVQDYIACLDDEYVYTITEKIVCQIEEIINECLKIPDYAI